MTSGPTPERKALAGRILRARLELGARQTPPRTITQEEIAGAMGVTGQAVSGWEAGVSEPTREKLARLATVLGVRAGWLSFGEEPMRYGELPNNGHSGNLRLG